ncbi:hypothetical protein [Thermomonospora cellulosilytica]|uniref:Uncharacterized protein n=1 Tax=Thermomonospora cellulosilytica TaxID=1411118 RepID=A0A7W3R6B1_9ACTN|nr:hypothetical protein [Thermomonospora cellulosilytica]MBA9001948.1 hypothetical protein [Thermomonospora cellulosilytica]
MIPPELENAPAYGIRRLGKVFGSVVAPASLVTGLLYFFGWSHAAHFCGYFGLDPALVGWSTADYLARSVDALFVPVTLLGVAVLAGLWIRALVRWRLEREAHPETTRVVLLAMTVIGVVLTVEGVVSLLYRPWPFRLHQMAPPLLLGVGVVLIASANRLARPRTAARGVSTTAIAEWAVVFSMISMASFWAVNEYAAIVGEHQAQRYVRMLPHYPMAVVYSKRRLSLTAPGISETTCDDRRAAYRYRYVGLKLLVHGAEQDILVPETWNTSRVTVLLPQTDSIRLEFVHPQHRWLAQTPSC